MVDFALPVGVNEELLRRLPKAELHLHLDGSLTPSFIERRAAARGIALPCPAQELREWLHAQKVRAREQNGNRQEKGRNWGVFDFCNQFLQTAGELSEATFELLCDLASHNVRLVELRFCPTLHCDDGLSAEEAVLAVIDGFRRGATSVEPPMQGGVILCALRSHPAQHGTEMVALARRMIDDPIQCGTAGWVVGFDVAGDEGNYPLQLQERVQVLGGGTPRLAADPRGSPQCSTKSTSRAFF